MNISLNEVKSSELSYQPLKFSFSQQLNLQTSVPQTVTLPEFSKVRKWIKQWTTHVQYLKQKGSAQNIFKVFLM